MGSTYTRQSSTEIVDGEVIQASDFNNEFEQLVSAFAASTGHSHDGTTAEGGNVTKLLGTAITIGDGTSGTDITVTFDGETSDGVLTWMEDEDHFKFSDDVVIDSTKRLYLNDEGGEYIYGDGTDLYLVSGADINIPANIGLTFGDDGEKIEGDGTDLTITGNNINLTATADVNIPSGVGVTFATAEKIESDGTDLSITVGSGGDINIPADIGVTFGNDGEKIEGDGTDLTITGNNINLTATADVVIPANVGITFGSGEKIEGDSTDLTVTSGADINLTATSDVNIPSGVGVTFGDDGEKIEGDGTNLTISTSNNVTVDAAADIILDAGGADVTLKDDGTTFGSLTNSGGELVIKSGSTPTTAMTFSGANVTFGGTVTIGSAGISEAELEILDGATVTTTELNLIDGDTARGTTSVASGDGILINDGGTMRMTNVDTVSTYFASHNVGGSNIVTTGALDSGSITSGFGNIDNGTSNITSGGLVKIDVDADADDLTADSSTGRLTIGANEDLNLYHGGTHSYIVNDIGDLILDTQLDIVLDADGGDIFFKDGGTTFGSATNTSGNLIIKSGTTTAATFSGANVTLAGTLGVGAITGTSTIQGTTITATTAFVPDASDGAALGTAALEFSDLFLADGAVINFGDDQEVTLTHVHNDGLLLNSDNQLQFRDSAINIRSDADGDLDINADDEIELNSTLIDINGNVDVSGTYTGGGLMTTGGNIVIPDAGNIGSASDTDAITIASSGDVGIGESSPSGYYGDRTLVISSTGSGENPTLTLRSATDGSGSLAFADGTSGADLYRGLIQYTHSNNRFTFLINGSNEIRLDADALYPASDDGTALGTSSEQWSDLYLADGGVVSLGDAGTVDMSTPLLAGTDHTYTGITAQMLAGGAISAFDLVCVHTTTSEVVEADASAYATARVIGIAPAAITDEATGTILLHGFIRDDSWNWTTGSTLYLSETAGAMTHTAPSTDGAFVQVVGVALSPDVVYINPSMDVIERA